MRPVRAAGVTVVLMFALTAVVTSAATAAKPEFLTPGGEKTKFTGTSGEAKFETVGKTEIRCKKSKSSGQLMAAKEGTYTLDFEECSALGFNCNSVGDAAGIILVGGNFVLAYILKPPTTHTGLVLLFTQFHIVCGTALVLLRMHGANGGLIVLIEPVNLLTNEFTWNVSQANGVQAETAYWLTAESAEVSAVYIEAAINAGAFEQAGLDMTNQKIKTEVNEIKIDA